MNIALILAGGIGTRIGADTPKQYIKIKDRPIISYCVDVFAEHTMIDCIQIVADEMWHGFVTENILTNKFKGFSAPGENRQMSVYNGLCDIKKYALENDIVIIHDAARPLVSEQMICDCIAAAERHDGALPVLPMKDTVYYSENGSCIASLLDRSKIFAGQTPEAFKLGKYYAANAALLPDRILRINGSTEPAVMAGMDIVFVEGDENNFKITTKADLKQFGEIIRRR